MVLGYPGLEDVFEIGLEVNAGALLVRMTQPAIADDIGDQNCGEPAFHALTGSGSARQGRPSSVYHIRNRQTKELAGRLRTHRRPTHLTTETRSCPVVAHRV